MANASTAIYIIIGIFIVAITFYAGYLTGENSVLKAPTSPTGAVVPTGQQPAQNQEPPQRVNVSTGEHILGSTDAPVTIVEFGDFQCPFCKTFYQDTEKRIVSEYVNTGKVRLAFRNFPLTSIHPFAEISSIAAECAAKVGGNDAYWKYHDILYTNGSGDGTGLDAASLKRYAASIGLDTNQFNECLDTNATLQIVQKDMQDATAAGVQGTPTFYINGYPLVGALPYNDFRQAIEIVMNATNKTG